MHVLEPLFECFCMCYMYIMCCLAPALRPCSSCRSNFGAHCVMYKALSVNAWQVHAHHAHCVLCMCQDPAVACSGPLLECTWHTQLTPGHQMP